MKREEKVMAEWPKELRDDAQPLEPLPASGSTDFFIIRFQGTENRKHMSRLSDFLQRENLDSDKVHIAFTSVEQGHRRWQPTNAWSVIRGAFDWTMSYGREVLNRDSAQVQNKQAHRDQRRRERASR